MQPDNDLLIDYLDKQLNAEETAAVAGQIQADPARAEEHAYLKLAVDTIRENALQARVAAVRDVYKAGRGQTKSQPAAVRSLFKISMRVAAISLLILGAAVLFKYLSVNEQTIYNKQFSEFELDNTRGATIPDAISAAYRNKNWHTVVSLYEKENNPANKDIFLAGISQMHMSHFPEAVILLEKITGGRQDSSFRDEAEYYLSLACLMNHEKGRSIYLLNKIKADKSHTYYPMASRIPSVDLKIIEMKN